MSHLLGRVIRHIFDPVSDPNFNADEADQLDRTIRAFDRLLFDEKEDCRKYCGTIGMCNRFVHSSFLKLTLTRSFFSRLEVLFVAVREG